MTASAAEFVSALGSEYRHRPAWASRSGLAWRGVEVGVGVGVRKFAFIFVFRLEREFVLKLAFKLKLKLLSSPILVFRLVLTFSMLELKFVLMNCFRRIVLQKTKTQSLRLPARPRSR